MAYSSCRIVGVTIVAWDNMPVEALDCSSRSRAIIYPMVISIGLGINPRMLKSLLAECYGILRYSGVN